MKGNLKKVFRFKTFYVILFLILIMLPTTLYMPSQAQSRAIVTAIGIDKTQDNLYEVTLAVITPKSGGQVGGGSMVESGTGQTVAMAMHLLSINLGKKLGLQHCDSIILSDDVLKEDLTNVLDYFIRTNNLTADANLINCPKSAKELITQGASSEASSVANINDIIQYNNEYLYSTNVTIYEFYNRYFSEAGSIYMPIIELEGQKNILDSFDTKEQENNSVSANSTSGTSSGETSSNSSSSDSSSSNSSSSNSDGSTSISNSNTSGSGADATNSSKLTSNGKCAVIKKGKKIREISENERIALNMLSKNSDKGIIGTENFTEGPLKNATVIMQFVNKEFSSKGYFENGKPKIEFDVDIIVKLDEIIMDKVEDSSITGLSSFMTPKLKEALIENINKCVNELIENMRRDKTDILFIYDTLNRFHHKELVKFMDTLEDKNDYLNYVDFITNIKIRGKI